MRLDFHKSHRLLYGVVLLGFIALTLIIAIGPAIWVNDHNAPLPSSQPLTAEERAGLGVYVGEGCLYCHSQQVRPLPQDRPYGRPAVPGDYARLHWLDMWRAPAMILGTERTGPDLSDVASRQPSATWQYLHLYQPRSVVPASVMPSFPWLFTVEASPAPDAVIVPVPAPYAPPAGKVVATARARALVAYLLSLQQPPLPGAGAGGATGAAAPAAAPPAGGPEAEGAEHVAPAVSGASVYGANCASCHQADGRGLAGVFPPLAGDPVVTAHDATEQIHTVLFGRQGKAIGGATYAAAMPPWGAQLSDAEIAAVINHERTSWGNHAPTVTAVEVAAVRRAGAAGAGDRHE
jgi:cytochrome c oxidase cbb3-type subunit 2